MNILEIKLTTSKIRSNFEKGKVSSAELKKWYQNYNKIEDIDFFIKEAKELFPRLNCGLATIYLKKIIKNGNIINGKYGKNNHTFLLINKELIVDITADQYGGPKIYVGPVQGPWSLV